MANQDDVHERRADATGLRDAVEAFVQAMQRREPAAIAEFFGDDGIGMYPRPVPYVGRVANQEAWRDYFARYDAHPLSVDDVRVAESGELGVVFGRHANSEAPGADVWAGRYVAVWKRNGGRWQIAVLSAHVHEDVAPFAFGAKQASSME